MEAVKQHQKRGAITGVSVEVVGGHREAPRLYWKPRVSPADVFHSYWQTRPGSKKQQKKPPGGGQMGGFGEDDEKVHVDFFVVDVVLIGEIKDLCGWVPP